MVGYNGWANYETWNVALWMQNDYPLYCMVLKFKDWRMPYLSFRMELKKSMLKCTKNGDGVSFFDPALDIEALTAMMREC